MVYLGSFQDSKLCYKYISFDEMLGAKRTLTEEIIIKSQNPLLCSNIRYCHSRSYKISKENACDNNGCILRVSSIYYLCRLLRCVLSFLFPRLPTGKWSQMHFKFCLDITS